MEWGRQGLRESSTQNSKRQQRGQSSLGKTLEMGTTLGLTLGRASSWERNARKGRKGNSIWKAGAEGNLLPWSHAEDSQSQLCPHLQMKAEPWKEEQTPQKGSAEFPAPAAACQSPGISLPRADPCPSVCSREKLDVLHCSARWQGGCTAWEGQGCGEGSLLLSSHSSLGPAALRGWNQGSEMSEPACGQDLSQFLWLIQHQKTVGPARNQELERKHGSREGHLSQQCQAGR